MIRALALLLLSCLPALAQVGASLSDVAWPNLAVNTISLPRTNDIVLWWNAHDPANPVSVWTDRIAGKKWVQNTGGNQPSVGTNGVVFNGSSSFLSNTNDLSGYDATGSHTASCSWLIIAHHNNVSGTRPIIGGNAFAGGQLFHAWDSGTTYYSGTHGDITLPVRTNTFDIFFPWITSGSPDTYAIYTNGLQAATATTQPLMPSPVALPFQFIGKVATPVWWGGTLFEVVVWTNRSGVWTAPEIAQIHKYASNSWDSANFTP